MVLERADSTFSGVAAVDAGGGKLEFYFFVGHKSFEGLGTLVVEALRLRPEASAAQSGMENFVPAKDAGARTAVAEGLRKYMVTIIIIHDHKIIIAIAQRGDEAPV
jgi:hypothetical protein